MMFWLVGSYRATTSICAKFLSILQEKTYFFFFFFYTLTFTQLLHQFIYFIICFLFLLKQGRSWDLVVFDINKVFFTSVVLAQGSTSALVLLQFMDYNKCIHGVPHILKVYSSYTLVMSYLARSQSLYFSLLLFYS